MKRRLKVIVIGAGIGGLAAARALSLRGHEVELHERVSDQR
jgi:FAD-dependent urate hydroxylase